MVSRFVYRSTLHIRARQGIAPWRLTEYFTIRAVEKVNRGEKVLGANAGAERRSTLDGKVMRKSRVGVVTRLATPDLPWYLRIPLDKHSPDFFGAVNCFHLISRSF